MTSHTLLRLNVYADFFFLKSTDIKLFGNFITLLVGTQRRLRKCANKVQLMLNSCLFPSLILWTMILNIFIDGVPMDSNILEFIANL